jgi:uroporphyrinogen III methyltransferase / synthase
MSLSGKTILVTRSENQAKEFVDLIESHNGNAVLFPTIKIDDPDSWQECDNAIKEINSYDAIIFTSRNAVEKFFTRLNIKTISTDIFSNLLIFAVGEKTKLEIEKHRLKVTAIPDNYAAESLSKTVSSLNVSGKKFLFPRGNLGRDVIVETLTSINARVKSVTVYKTQKADISDSQAIKEKILNGKIDAVTFTSPSTVKNFFSLFPEQVKNEFAKKTVFVVIGEVTGEALQNLGIQPMVCAQPSIIEGMITAIENYFKD